MVFGSNFKKKKSLIALVLLFLVSGVCVAVFKIDQTNIFYLVRQEYYDTDRMYLSYYQDQNPDNSFLVTPQIQSDIIEGSPVKLFIPIFDNERNYQEDTCGYFKDNDSLSKKENRENARKFYLDCYGKYNSVKLNGENINLGFLKKNHQTSEQFGIVCFIEYEKLAKGKNILEVYKTLGDVKTYTWTIPFYFQPEFTN
jgi:hypothetical protein